MANLFSYANNASTTLSSAIAFDATTIPVASTAKFPNSFPFYITVDDSVGNIEIMWVTAKTGSSFTVLRAQDGTTAKAFPANITVENRVVQHNLNRFESAATDGVLIDGSKSMTGTLNQNTLNSVALFHVGSVDQNTVSNWYIGGAGVQMNIKNTNYNSAGLRWVRDGAGYGIAAVSAVDGFPGSPANTRLLFSLRGKDNAMSIYQDYLEVGGTAQYLPNGNVNSSAWTRGASTDLKSYIDKVIPNTNNVATIGTVQANGSGTPLSASVINKWFFLFDGSGSNTYSGPYFGLPNANFNCLQPTTSTVQVTYFSLNAAGTVIFSPNGSIQGKQVVIITSSAV